MEHVPQRHAAESTPARVGRAVTPARPPYAGYAAILAAFGGALAASAGLERALGRQARPASHLEFLVLCAGSFKAARALSRERIGSVLRQPFVESETREGVGLTHEDPAGEGLQRALGELVTCTRGRHMDAAGILTCQAVAPRFGQLLTWSLAAGAGNDFLQAAFAALIARELPGARETSVAVPTSRGLSSEHIARDVGGQGRRSPSRRARGSPARDFKTCAVWQSNARSIRPTRRAVQAVPACASRGAQAHSR